ncbi:MAG: hypothetical protein L3J49_05955 [Desulfobulbaceae bacterium]|nr:hypothetical protein [Desulfobulbaceae bacterium]
MTEEEFQTSLQEILQSAQFPPDTRTLWDLRELDFSTIDSLMEKRFITIRREYPERGRARLAFIVAGDLAFGMGRMYEMLSEDLPQTIRTFRKYSEGENWLLGR